MGRAGLPGPAPRREERNAAMQVYVAGVTGPPRLRAEYPLAARTGEVPLVADVSNLEPRAGTLTCPGCRRRVALLYVTVTKLIRCGHCVAPTRASPISENGATSRESSAPLPPSNFANSAASRTERFGTPARARVG